MPFINGGHDVEWAPEIGTFASLGVIVGAMAIAVLASVVRLRVDDGRSARDTSERSGAGVAKSALRRLLPCGMMSGTRKGS